MKKFFAVVLLAATVLTLCSCGKKPVDENTTLPTEAVVPGTTDEAETSALPEATTGEVTTGELTTVESTVPEQTTAEVTDSAETTAAAAIPTGIPAIVEYFNTASNAVKADKPGYTVTNSHKIGKITSGSGFIEKVAGWIVPMFDADPEVTKVAKGESHSSYPVKGQSWSSKLEPAAVKSATCVENGENYVIEIKLKPETLSDLPKDPSKTNHGKVMSVLTADEVYTETDKFKSMAKVESFAPTFSNSYVKCTVNKTTGKVVSSEYHFNTNAKIKASVKLFGELTCNVPFEIIDKYVINY